jgi:hypothetical protein
MINEQLLNPRSIVVIGGSNNVHKPGGAIVRNIINGGYQGDLRIVNPKEDEVHHDELRWDDPRRVLQIPQNVIDAGYPSSNRVKSLDADDGDGMKAVPVLAEPEPKHQDNNNE